MHTTTELSPESENWSVSITTRSVNEFEHPKDILLMHINTCRAVFGLLCMQTILIEFLNNDRYRY
jgi:hypothetical protein